MQAQVEPGGDAGGAEDVTVVDIHPVEDDLDFRVPLAELVGVLATDLAAALMAIEEVPDIAMFRRNTAAFVHEMPAGDLSNVDGASNYVRVQVLTNAGALDRDKQLAVVSRFTGMIADAAHDRTLTERTWVLLTEAVPGGWGLGGHANTNEDLVAAARKQIAALQA